MLSCVALFYCRIACPVGLNCDQMEEGEQYSEYLMERNPIAYMSMRDYRCHTPILGLTRLAD